jgi:predicted MFS family arabinose efflux permease
MLLWASCIPGPYAGGFHAFLSFFPSYLHVEGWPPATAATLMALLGWAPIVMGPLGGMIVSRIGHEGLIMGLSIFIWGACAIILPIVGVTWWLIGLMIVFGPLVIGPVMSLGAQAVAPERRGIGSGIFLGGMFLGIAGLPPAAGWVGEAAPWLAGQAEASALLFCGAAFLVALLPLALFMRARRWDG